MDKESRYNERGEGTLFFVLKQNILSIMRNNAERIYGRIDGKVKGKLVLGSSIYSRNTPAIFLVKGKEPFEPKLIDVETVDDLEEISWYEIKFGKLYGHQIGIKGETQLYEISEDEVNRIRNLNLERKIMKGYTEMETLAQKIIEGIRERRDNGCIFLYGEDSWKLHKIVEDLEHVTSDWQTSLYSLDKINNQDHQKRAK